MTYIPRKYIQVNIPLTEQEYLSGNGEGVWLEVDEKTRQAYDRDAVGGGYSGILSNDSIYYPGLKCGMVLPFEMRGQNRPVVEYYRALAGRVRLTAEGKAAVLRKIAEKQIGDERV